MVRMTKQLRMRVVYHLHGISLEKDKSALDTDELTNYKLVNRENPDLNFDTSFVKFG